jgi:hypothetical protein
MRLARSIASASLVVCAAGCNAGTNTPADVGSIVDVGSPDAAAGHDASTEDVGAADMGAQDAPAPVDGSSPDAYRTPDSGPPGPDANVPCDPATTDCGIGFYCHTPDGMCGGMGTCELAAPSAPCLGDVSPVCGCDGNSYDNACMAARAGTSVDTPGLCPGGTLCTTVLDCMPGEYCLYADGRCMGSGVCTSRGIGRFCADICEPVCGCDGQSYTNSCQLQLAGQSIMSRGNCPAGPPACTVGGGCCATGADCTPMQECVGGHPGSMTGRCEPIHAPPTCWTDFDCDATAGLHCVGAFVCPCGSTCPRPDATGMCM